MLAPRTFAIAAALIVSAAAAQAGLVASNPCAPGAADAGAYSQPSQQLVSPFSLASATSLTRATLALVAAALLALSLRGRTV